jgi:DNA-binding protein HU-beta
MNKAELIERVSKDTNLTKTDVENTLNSITKWIKDCVKKNDEVKLIGFGTFTRTKRKARTGRNPQTGAEIKIPATNVPRFKPGKEFKELIN